MENFKNFYNKLINSKDKRISLAINGTNKEIKGMVRLTSKNYFPDNNEYIKMLFDDGSFLLVLKNEEELYYANNVLGKIEEISDEDIGKKELIYFNGKEYKLDNKDDYQFVLDLIKGNPYEIEGECRFSDYSPVDGTKEFLSLGWLSYNGERADINPKFLEQSKVEIVE